MTDYIKNKGVTGFPFGLVHKTDLDPVTVGPVTVYITKDGGIQTVSEGISIHKGNGQWIIDLTPSEMNADIVALLFTHVDVISQSFVIHTHKE